jgi:hypothetical protein
LGFADTTKWLACKLVRRRRRNPTKDIGMLNPTYEEAVADVKTKPGFYNYFMKLNLKAGLYLL